MLIQQIALLQVGSAFNGFFLRGGITIGEIIHDSESCFGPGLNRAYELESTVARFPRFVLDADVDFGNIGDLPAIEDGVRFLNPFTLTFLDFIRKGRPHASNETLLAAGLPIARTSIDKVPADKLLGAVLDEVKKQIRARIDDAAWEKLAWLFDRIARQLGVPLARSYPRAT
jgi:hypothetical protein